MATRELTPEQRDRKNAQARERRAALALKLVETAEEPVVRGRIDVVQATPEQQKVQSWPNPQHIKGAQMTINEISTTAPAKSPAQMIRGLMPWIEQNFGPIPVLNQPEVNFDVPVDSTGPVKMPVRAKYKTGHEIKAKASV